MKVNTKKVTRRRGVIAATNLVLYMIGCAVVFISPIIAMDALFRVIGIA